MLHRLSISDLQAICDRYENLQKNLPPMMSMGSEEYRYARATLDRIQKQKEAEGHSTQILQMVHRIDQHLDVVEEKIDGVPIRPPSPETQLASQLEIQKREMEAMKGMMEMMRLDKERQERELATTKLRLEQEAKLRAQQEEIRELAEIIKRLHETNMKSYWHSLDDNSRALLTSLSQHETVLFYSCHAQSLTYIITNKNIYHVWGHNHPSPICGPLYTFDTTLTKKQILFLEKGIMTDCSGTGEGPILKRMSRYQHSLNPGLYRHISTPKKFESLVRLIPGAYKNGDWRQLDGFFGMYYNETTMELSEYPPSL